MIQRSMRSDSTFSIPKRKVTYVFPSTWSMVVLTDISFLVTTKSASMTCLFLPSKKGWAHVTRVKFPTFKLSKVRAYPCCRHDILMD